MSQSAVSISLTVRCGDAANALDFYAKACARAKELFGA
jgi:hypothetical protein